MSRAGQRTAAEAKYLDVCSRSTHKPEQRFLSALRTKRCEIELPNEADYIEAVSKVIKDRAAAREVNFLKFRRLFFFATPTSPTKPAG
jgi:hypothetical protein